MRVPLGKHSFKEKGKFMSIAFVFPGQGAQTIGMGKDLAEAYPAAKAVFQEVDDALGENLSGLIWDGDIAELTLTPGKTSLPADFNPSQTGLHHGVYPH